MFYCPEKKIAVFMPPRTGSTTLKHIFDLWGLKTVDDERHLLPNKAFEHISNFAEYKTYGFIRNPLERHLSAIRLLQQSNIDRENKKLKIGMTYEQMMEIIKSIPDLPEVVFRPQYEWLRDSELLDFDNYDLEVLKLAKLLGQTKVKIDKHFSTTKNLVPPPSGELKSYVREHYAADYALAKDGLGKEYA